jgi:hypothetical protein
MSSQSQEVREYLFKKVPTRGPDDDDFWPWMHPDKHYIPFCSTCQADYESAKSASLGKKVEWDHSSACLWYDWFIKKLQNVNPHVVITRKLGRSEKVETIANKSSKK